jgi:hypothetical protein
LIFICKVCQSTNQAHLIITKSNMMGQFDDVCIESTYKLTLGHFLLVYWTHGYTRQHVILINHDKIFISLKLQASWWAKIFQEKQYWEKCSKHFRKVNTFLLPSTLISRIFAVRSWFYFVWRQSVLWWFESLWNVDLPNTVAF